MRGKGESEKETFCCCHRAMIYVSASGDGSDGLLCLLEYFMSISDIDEA